MLIWLLVLQVMIVTQASEVSVVDRQVVVDHQEIGKLYTN
jgi:hypothetical protein